MTSGGSIASTARRSSRLARPDLRFAFDVATLRAPLLAWYRRVRRPLPWRTLWQKHRDPYHVWVSEIMLQQTVIKAVLPVYDRFLTRFPTVEALAEADEESVRQAVRGLGYYRRFRMLHEATQELRRRDFVWPTTYDGWKELPGIGDYTASAISSIAFDVHAAVLDGNVERVFARLLDLRAVPSDPHIKPVLRRLAQDFLAPQSPGDFNQGLMELGQTVCTVGTPDCAACPLATGCLARQRGSQALAPAPKPPKAMTDVAMRLVILQRDGLIGLYERPRSARFLKGTWGFLTALTRPDGDSLDGLAATPPPSLGAIGRVRHSITHHKIDAQVEVLDAAKTKALAVGLRWLKPAQVEEHLVSNLDRKAWRVYQTAAVNPRARASRA